MIGLRRNGGGELHLITNISFNCQKKSVHRNAVAKKKSCRSSPFKLILFIVS